MLYFFSLLIAVGICLYLFNISTTFLLDHQIREMDKKVDDTLKQILQKKKKK
jgi:hypothetical protein